MFIICVSDWLYAITPPFTLRCGSPFDFFSTLLVAVRVAYNVRRLGEGGGLTDVATKIQNFLLLSNCRAATPLLLPPRSSSEANRTELESSTKSNRSLGVRHFNVLFLIIRSLCLISKTFSQISVKFLSKVYY